MRKKKRLLAQKLLEFAAVIGDRHLIALTVGPSFEPILLSLGKSPDYRISTGRGSFPKRRAESPNGFRIHHLAGEDWGSIDLAETSENYHFLQPLPEGNWLLVRGRADNEQDGDAHVYGSDGSWLRSFHAGDGIADVQATERGKVWVSYFDEGVFGDTALGQSGLACLDKNGTPVFRLSDLPEPVLESMADWPPTG
jgi:hypothetical protein